MPRPPSAYYDQKARCWRSKSVGRLSERTGRPVGARNYDIGPPTGRDGTANKRAAQAWLDGLLDEERQAGRAATDPTFAELASAYLDWIAGHTEASTVAGYREIGRASCRERVSTPV